MEFRPDDSSTNHAIKQLEGIYEPTRFKDGVLKPTTTPQPLPHLVVGVKKGEDGNFELIVIEFDI